MTWINPKDYWKTPLANVHFTSLHITLISQRPPSCFDLVDYSEVINMDSFEKLVINRPFPPLFFFSFLFIYAGYFLVQMTVRARMNTLDTMTNI